MNEEDKENLEWLHVFNKYDLYSKSKVRVDVEKVKPYYLSLIEKVKISTSFHISQFVALLWLSTCLSICPSFTNGMLIC